MKRSTFLLVIAAVAFSKTPLHSLQQKPAFDVVSIRPNNSGTRGTTTNVNGGLVRITNVSVRELILQAYGVADSQLFGGPNWASADRFDIQARIESGAIPISGLPQMMQSLLQERFAFKSHMESREQPVFLLTVAKGGPKMKVREGAVAPGAGALVQGSASTNSTPAGVEMVGNGITIARLSRMIASRAGRPIIDNTNLNGLYDFTLTFVQNVTADSTGPSLFTALQEQLGLRLDAGRGPVEVLVIDDVQRPTEN